jgi:tRNA 2-thiouridine synthesizing protein C
VLPIYPLWGQRLAPILILVTKSPYGTETTFGALSFATACAHEGIATRVVFIEEGVLSLAGNHKLAGESTMLNMQEVINAVAGSPNLNFFAFVPSIEKRGLHKNKALTAVIDIGYQELGQIIFGQPASVQSDHQRIVIF